MGSKEKADGSAIIYLRKNCDFLVKRTYDHCPRCEKRKRGGKGRKKAGVSLKNNGEKQQNR
jgi:hypothetical protein